MLEAIDHDLSHTFWQEICRIEDKAWDAKRIVGGEREVDAYMADFKRKMLLVINWWKYTLEKNPDLIDGQLPTLKEVDAAFLNFSEWVKTTTDEV
jgi:hypothetical protein